MCLARAPETALSRQDRRAGPVTRRSGPWGRCVTPRPDLAGLVIRRLERLTMPGCCRSALHERRGCALDAWAEGRPIRLERGADEDIGVVTAGDEASDFAVGVACDLGEIVIDDA